jgi:hypothetical protein
MIANKTVIPPLVLTRSGNAGRALYAPLSLYICRLPVQLCLQYMTMRMGCQDKHHRQ